MYIIYMNNMYYIHLYIHGHLGSSHLLAVVNSTAVNRCIQISLLDSAFSSFGYIRRSEIAVTKCRWYWHSLDFGLLRFVSCYFLSLQKFWNLTHSSVPTDPFPGSFYIMSLALLFLYCHCNTQEKEETSAPVFHLQLKLYYFIFSN